MLLANIYLFTFFILATSVSCCELPRSFCGGNELVLDDYGECGSKLTEETTQSQPSISFSGLNQDKLYTLVMVDPDAPDPYNPTQKYWLHWLVTDIKGSNFQNSGLTKMKYNGPTPPKGTHRYQFLLFEQNGVSALETPSQRGQFRLEQILGDNSCTQIVATFEYKVSAENRK